MSRTTLQRTRSNRKRSASPRVNVFAKELDSYLEEMVRSYGSHEGRARVVSAFVRWAATPSTADWQAGALFFRAKHLISALVHEFDAAEAERIARAEAAERERIAANRRSYLERDTAIQQALVA